MRKDTKKFCVIKKTSKGKKKGLKFFLNRVEDLLLKRFKAAKVKVPKLSGEEEGKGS